MFQNYIGTWVFANSMFNPTRQFVENKGTKMLICRDDTMGEKHKYFPMRAKNLLNIYLIVKKEGEARESLMEITSCFNGNDDPLNQ